MGRRALLSILLACALAPVSPSQAKKPAAATIAKAKAFFARWVALGEAFDPAVADLYADDAVIENRRQYPTGQSKVLTIPAGQYKQMLRALMGMAKARGDRSTYSNAKYAIEGSRVRITATRTSLLKRYDSPHSLLVGEGPKGGWLIFGEWSESRP